MGKFNMLRLWRRYQAKRWTVILALGALALTAMLGSGALIYAHPAFLGQDPGPVKLHGHTIPALAHAKALRATDGATALDLAVALTPRDQSGLDALIAAQNDRKSPQYHKYLTSEQFAARFGPTQATVDAVKAFLAGQGLVVRDVSPNHLIVHVAGSVSTVEHALGVQIDDYQLGARVVHAPSNDPAVPSALGGVITGIAGLDNAARPVSHAIRPNDRPNAITPQNGSFAGYYTPSDVRNAYDINPLINSGWSGSQYVHVGGVGVIELSNFRASDVASYRSYFGLPSATMNTFAVDGGTSDSSGAVEAALDLELIAAVAPTAAQNVYVAPATTTGYLDAFSNAVAAGVSVISTSWGDCEQAFSAGTLNAFNNTFYQAAVTGISIFAASGDAGSHDCLDTNGNPITTFTAVEFPASSPYVIGAGGTTLTTGTGGSYTSEQAWSGSGGGYSLAFSRPSWQSSPGVDTGSSARRQVPDVSADADPATGYAIYCSEPAAGCSTAGFYAVAGTSAASPLWAGMLADILTAANATGTQTPAAWINADLYDIENSPFYPSRSAFHDVTSGPSNGTYSAGQGYDRVTGLGTPDAWNFAREELPLVLAMTDEQPNPHIQHAVTLSTTPGVAPGDVNLRMHNFGLETANWQLSVPADSASWLTVSQSGTAVSGTASGSVAAGYLVPVTLHFHDIGTASKTYTTTLTFTGTDPAGGAAIGAPYSLPVTVVASSVSTQWYFAEGYIGGSFQTIVTVANPGPTPANVTFTYRLDQGGGVVQHQNVTVAANSRYTEDVNKWVHQLTGNGVGYGVATTVTADQPVVAERPMYYTYTNGATGQVVRTGFDVVGATALGSSFAFGYLDTTANRRTLLLALNPTANPMYLTVTYYPASGGAPIARQHTIAADARGGVDVGHDEGLPAGVYSATVKLTSDQAGTTPVDGLVERPMYFINPGTGAQYATCLIGVTQPTTAAYFAEGFTGTDTGAARRGQFHETLYVAYPAASGAAAANVTVTIYKETGGAPVVVNVAVAAGTVQAVDVNGALPGYGLGNSIKVSSDQPILAQRLMTFDYGASDVLGAPAPSYEQLFAEGFTGGGFDEIVTLQNPNATTAYVAVTFLPEFPSASNPARTVVFAVAPQSRYTFLANSYMPSQGFSLQAVSDVPVLIERPMYWGGGETDVIGYQPDGSLAAG